jgi:hypothetical protein
MWQLLEAGAYVEAQRELIRVALPFMELCADLTRIRAETASRTSCAWSLSALGRVAAGRRRETSARTTVRRRERCS